MGKGDKKSKRGKIIMGSYGVTRKRKSTAAKVAPKKAVTAKKAAPAKKAEATEAAPKKAAPKKKKAE